MTRPGTREALEILGSVFFVGTVAVWLFYAFFWSMTQVDMLHRDDLLQFYKYIFYIAAGSSLTTNIWALALRK